MAWPRRYDALAAVLLHPVGPARRHVVIARTKGVDTMSAVDAGALGAIAGKSDARFHLVLMETALTNDGEARTWQCREIGQCWPTVRSWIPHKSWLIDDGEFHRVTTNGLLVKAGVEATGGAWHQASGLSVPSLTGTFKVDVRRFSGRATCCGTRRRACRAVGGTKST